MLSIFYYLLIAGFDTNQCSGRTKRSSLRKLCSSFSHVQPAATFAYSSLTQVRFIALHMFAWF